MQGALLRFYVHETNATTADCYGSGCWNKPTNTASAAARRFAPWRVSAGIMCCTRATSSS